MCLQTVKPLVSGEELRAAFFNYGGARIYQGIDGPYAVEKKYCAAYDYLEMLSANVGIKIDPMPPHPRTLTQITVDNLTEIETDLGIAFSCFHGGLCMVAKAAFGS